MAGGSDRFEAMMGMLKGPCSTRKGDPAEVAGPFPDHAAHDVVDANETRR